MMNAGTSVRAGRALDGSSPAPQYGFHGHETVVEASSQARMLPWLQVRPDAQYVVTPGGGIPDRPNQKVGSAAVFGIRTIVTF